MLAEVFHPSQLTARDAETWRAMCAATPGFGNPLLSPDFAQLVGEVREDARVAVFRKGTETVGFLAHHRRPDGFARPIGAAFSDYQALVTWPDAALDGALALAAAGVSAIRFSALIDPHRLFDGSTREGDTSYVIEPGPDRQAYFANLKADNPKRLRNWRRLHNKLEREAGELSVTPGDTSRDAFEQLITWKREQYRRTGAHDMYRPDWARRFLWRAFERREGPLRGVMTTLRANGKVVAGHFGPAIGGIWHGWISAIGPDHTACGPGFVLMLEVPAVMEALGLDTYDMAPSHEHYKAPFATREWKVREGLVLADSPAGRQVGRLESVLSLAGAERVPVLSRLRRRLDHIASVELSVGGRMLGLAEALAGYGRRNLHRKIAEETAAREAA
jgi:CelD/BcsL family acetyltransferase involved in cellulose biosynthesis